MSCYASTSLLEVIAEAVSTADGCAERSWTWPLQRREQDQDFPLKAVATELKEFKVRTAPSKEWEQISVAPALSYRKG